LLLVALFLALAPTALASNSWYVDGVNGNDNNDCKTPQTACKTIGHAISLCSPGDTIMVAPAIYTENLTIEISLKIIGSGAATTIVDGNQAGSVVTISNGRVTLSKLTIRDGNGGGIGNTGTLTVNHSTISANSTSFCGGGIGNTGTLTINHSTISGNSATNCGVGIYQGGGTLTINSSTITANTAFQGGGVGIFGSNGGLTAINNSTLSGNSATEWGGGIGNWYGLAINNSTLSGNSATYGGGIWTYGTATIQNSIVAKSTSGGNCYGGTITSNGYNLSSDNTCNFNGSGDMNNIKAKLGKLGNYGGPTQTIFLFKGSPAIEAGNPNGCTDGNGNPLKTDQRGYPRPGKHKHDKRCDMGAFETQWD